MKKYHQLLLLLLSVISIFCFVFYKHEYDRLRRVLEVLDFFGSPADSSMKSLPDVLPSMSPDESLHLVPDVWQKYSDDIQFYSATRMANEKGWSMSSLAIFKKDGAATLKKFSCALISGDTVEDKFEGTIEWKEIASDSSMSAFEVICNVPEVPGRSHLLSIYEANSIHVPLNLPLNHAPELSQEKTTSLCAVSQDPVWRVTESIDFIRYHAALGVKCFSIYHRGISNQLISSLKELIRTHSNLKISLVPWNTPTLSSLSLDYSLVSHACATRHVAKSGPVVVMPWAQFLALPKDNNFESFLYKVSQNEREAVHEMRLGIQPLCSNIPIGEPSPRRQNLYLKNHKTESKSGILRWTESSNLFGKPIITKIDAHNAKLISLEPCPLNGNEAVNDDVAVLAYSAVAQKLAL